MTTLTISSVTPTQASGTLTSNNTNVSNGNTVTIGTAVYTFVTTLTPSTTAYNVLIGGSADASLLNLIRAINGSGTPGTDYGSLTPQNLQVTAATSVTAHSFAVTAVDSSNTAVSTTTSAATLSWGSTVLSGATVTVVMSESDATFYQPSSRVTVPDFPSGNTAWSRAVQVTDAAVFCLRNGVSGVAMRLSSWSQVCYYLNPALTWFTQPAAASCVHASTAAVFTVVGSTELAPSAYAWQYSSNGLNGWTAASGTVNGCAYTNNTTASLTCTPTTTGQNGVYHRCLVTTPAGVKTSSAVVLTIT